MKAPCYACQVLLVFGKEDAQSDAFKRAADHGGYVNHIAKSSEAALELYIEHQHDLVVIDCRHSKQFDHESLCR